MKTLSKTVVSLMAAVAMTASASVAVAGDSVAQSKQVVFYYESGSGDGNSKSFSGYGSARMQMDAPGCCSNGGSGSFGGYLYKKRTLQFDDIVRAKTKRYSDSRYTSSRTTLSSSSKYYTKSVWGAVTRPQPGYPNGYVRAI